MVQNSTTGPCQSFGAAWLLLLGNGHCRGPRGARLLSLTKKSEGWCLVVETPGKQPNRKSGNNPSGKSGNLEILNTVEKEG